MSENVAEIYEFDGFRLDVTERLLVKADSERIFLTEKAFETLCVLVRNAGHLVKKDELLSHIWADSIVEENNLNKCIHAIRRALGQRLDGQPYVETVKKHGFRFVPEVRQVSNSNDNRPVTGEAGRSLSPARFERRIRTRYFTLVVAAVLMTCLIGTLYYYSRSTNTIGKDNRSIAILPLRPLTADFRDFIYEFGVAESLIGKLSSAKNLRVLPLSTSLKYSGVDQDLTAAGREMHVDYVFAAIYQLANGKIRITGQLTSIATGRVEKTYEINKDRTYNLVIQDQISEELANLLLTQFSLPPNAAAIKIGTNNDEAYRLYSHGRNLTGQRSQKDALLAVEQFKKAIELDPNFAKAYAGMARAYITSANLGSGLPRVESELAKVAVKKAFELDVNLAEAYSVSGQIKVVYDWDFTGAELDLRRAIELEPNNDLAHWMYALLFAYRGQFNEAIDEIDVALVINPASLMIQRDRGRILYLARRYDQAIVQLKRVIEVDENFFTAYMYLRLAYEMHGDEKAAFELFMKELKSEDANTVEFFQRIYETAGWPGVRRQNLEDLKLDKDSLNLVWILARQAAQLGEKDLAFECLNMAVERRQWQVTMLKVEPQFDPIRDDPRFNDLLKRTGL